MLHALAVTSTALVHALIIVAVLAVLGILAAVWHTARRWRLVVLELRNSTGQPALDGVTPGLTQLARQRIDREIRIVSDRREQLYAALTGPGQAVANRPGARRPASRQTPPARVEQRLDDSLAQLLSAARDVTPQQAQPAVQLLAMLVSRPHGLLVAGIMQQRGDAGAGRLGVTFDVLRPDGNQSLASQTFWEPLTPPGAPDAAVLSPQERLITLFGPAARWVAIQLVINTVFPHGARHAEKGLDRLLSGLLFRQSAGAYPGYATTFCRRAAEDLADAAAVLTESPRPLAALADTLDQLAAAEPAENGTEKTRLYQSAHQQYARALNAMQRMHPADPGLLHRYQVRQVISWLASGLPAAQELARQQLATDRLNPEADPSAAVLYDMACLYALAAETGGNAEWRTRAGCLLLRALATDPPPRRLWASAPDDPQLRLLHGYLAAFMAAVDAAAARSDSNVLAGLDVDAVVAQAFAAAS